MRYPADPRLHPALAPERALASPGREPRREPLRDAFQRNIDWASTEASYEDARRVGGGEGHARRRSSVPGHRCPSDQAARPRV